MSSCSARYFGTKPALSRWRHWCAQKYRRGDAIR